MNKKTILSLLYFLAQITLGNVSTYAEQKEIPIDDQTLFSNESVDYDLQPEDKEIWDPGEKVNRAIFSFNDFLDVYLLEPISKGYKYITPDPVEKSIGNFFDNLSYPSSLVSSVVQGDLSKAGLHTERFLINSTLGVAGLFDVASKFNLKKREDDFGLALASYNLPAGPYIVIPFLGPSNLRDGTGRIVDFFLDPFVILQHTSVPSKEASDIAIGAFALRTVSTRARLSEAITASKESSLDYYSFLQSSYYQYRRGLLKEDNFIKDSKAPFNP